MTGVVATTPAQAFLNAVRKRGVDSEAAVRHAEDERTLPADVVELMRDLRLFWLKPRPARGLRRTGPADLRGSVRRSRHGRAGRRWVHGDRPLGLQQWDQRLRMACRRLRGR
jgi:hypothetical protein